MSERQTVILLRGTAGIGKSALLHELAAGHGHLFNVACLQGALSRGYGYLQGALSRGYGYLQGALSRGYGYLPVALSYATVTAGGDLAALVAEHIGDKPYLIAEVDAYGDAVVEACRDKYDLLLLFLVGSPHLTLARRRLRYLHLTGAAHPYWQHRHIVTDAALVQYALRCYEGVERVLCWTDDYPWVEVSGEEALARLAPVPELALAPAKQYQQCLHIGGQWYGNADPGRRALEQARLDAALPTCLSGMTVLDIGASDGGFCYEALGLGALYCVAVDNRPDRVALMRHLRDQHQLAMTAVQMDVMSEGLPTLTVIDEPRRYDLGLLLNVLHHCPEVAGVERLLRTVLRVCNYVVVETPFAVGTEPVKLNISPYPDKWHLPPAWVRSVAGAEGFDLREMRVSPLMPDQRMIYCLTRR